MLYYCAMDFNSLEYRICRGIWKSNEFPQLCFFEPLGWFNTTAFYAGKVMVGVSVPSVLIPYKVTENILTIRDSVFTISYIKRSGECKWLHDMELIDANGNSIMLHEELRADTMQPSHSIRVPF